MRISGERWEDWIYPILREGSTRRVRSLLPDEVLVQMVAWWLRSGRSVLAAPYFAAVAQSASFVLPDAVIESFLRDHLRFIIRFYLKMADMMESRRDVIKLDLRRRLKTRLCGLETALASGRGILMPTVQTTVPLRVIFADFPATGRYNLLLQRQYAGILGILEKADPEWKFLFLEDAPARAVVDALRRGEVVICNIDHAYPDTEVTLAPVLGRAAIVPSGAFRAAHRYGALVVPLLLTEEGSHAVISAEATFDWREGEKLPIADMLERVHPLLDDAVLNAPACWFGWGNLVGRWQAWTRYIQ